MITKLKKVYYCEFCGKHGMHPYHIKNHEKVCTMNIDRECGLCGDFISTEIGQFQNAYEINNGTLQWNKVVSLYDIREYCKGCPVCILAVLRICKFTEFYKYTVNYGLINPVTGNLIESDFAFDYKKELAECKKVNPPLCDYDY